MKDISDDKDNPWDYAEFVKWRNVKIPKAISYLEETIKKEISNKIKIPKQDDIF